MTITISITSSSFFFFFLITVWFLFIKRQISTQVELRASCFVVLASLVFCGICGPHVLYFDYQCLRASWFAIWLSTFAGFIFCSLIINVCGPHDLQFNYQCLWASRFAVWLSTFAGLMFCNLIINVCNCLSLFYISFCDIVVWKINQLLNPKKILIEFKPTVYNPLVHMIYLKYEFITNDVFI